MPVQVPDLGREAHQGVDQRDRDLEAQVVAARLRDRRALELVVALLRHPRDLLPLLVVLIPPSLATSAASPPPGLLDVLDPPEPRVRRLPHDKHQIARVPVDLGLALFKESNLLPRSRPGLDRHLDLGGFPHELDSVALVALVLGVLLVHPGTDLAGHDPLAAVALAFPGRGGQRHLVPRHLHRGPQVELLEREVEVDADVCPSRGRGLSLAVSSGEAKGVASAEEAGFFVVGGGDGEREAS